LQHLDEWSAITGILVQGLLEENDTTDVLLNVWRGEEHLSEITAVDFFIGDSDAGQLHKKEEGGVEEGRGRVCVCERERLGGETWGAGERDVCDGLSREMTTKPHTVKADLVSSMSI